MKFLDPKRDWRELNRFNIIGMIIVIAMSVYTYMIISGRVVASPAVRGGILIAFTILINLIDINMFRTLLHIRDRKEAVKFMIFASINVVIFQVIFETIGGYTEFVWAALLCSAMYNISFCYLFIVWFKLFDFIHEGLHEGLKGESLRETYNHECDDLGK